jgi:hypothetical protein
MHEPCKVPSSPEHPRSAEGTEPRRQRSPYVPPQLIDYGSVTSLTQGIHSRNHGFFGTRTLGKGK